jgi:hypothetical protein
LIDKERFASVLLGGFVTGLLGAAILSVSQSRAELIAAHFEEICIPNHYGNLHVSPAHWQFEDVLDTDRRPIWIHPKTAAILKIEPGQCSLSTFAPHELSASEANDLLKLVEELVADRFPELSLNPNAKLASITKSWARGKGASPERWGVFYYAAPEWGENATSDLSIRAPRTEF